MKTFYVGIKGVILQDHKVLLLHTDPNHEDRGDRWEMPGGRMDANETVEQTLKRELKEELPNIKNIEVGKILSSHRLHINMYGSNSLMLIFYHVKADFGGGEPKLSEEHSEYQWANQARAIELTEDNTHQAISTAFELKK